MVGVVSANWIAGGIGALSIFTMPGLLSAPVGGALLAQQWQTMYDLGKAVMPTIAVGSLAAFAYAAYDRSRRHLDWKRYATAGGLTLAIVPFTLIFMHPTNRSLLQIAGGGATAVVVNDDSVRALITKWAGLNLVRSLLPLAGAVVGIWALVDEAPWVADRGEDVTKSHPASYTK